jgi:hypothetical protein
MVAISMGTSAFNMPSCIRPVPVRYCETSKSKLRHWRSPLALASVGTAPISVAMWVSCELRRRSPRSCSLELACHDRPEGKVPPVSTLCSESELFDTALENCRAQTESIPDASEPPCPSARAVCVRKRPQHGPTNANSINSPVRVAESSSTGNSYRRGRFGLAWYGGNNDALKLLMSSV